MKENEGEELGQKDRRRDETGGWKAEKSDSIGDKIG